MAESGNGTAGAAADVPPPVSPWTPEMLAMLPHDNAGMRLIVSIWVMNVLALGFLLARVYCKFLRHRGLWWDDGVLIGAYVSRLLVLSSMTGPMAFDPNTMSRSV
jgi:hypothetical protein